MNPEECASTVEEVVTEVEKVGGASVEMVQRIERDGATLCAARARVACMTEAGRPARLSPALRAALMRLAAPGGAS